MDGEPLPPDECTKEQEAAKALYALVAGPLAAAQARLAAHSRAIPSSTDFHFYNNFDQFKTPAREVCKKSLDLLGRVGACGLLPEGQRRAELPDDLEDACDWIVSVNDDLLERFGAAMDEFKSSREELEASAVAGGKAGRAAMEEGGFQIVHGKKKKKSFLVDDGTADSEGSDAKAALRDKKITPARFHIHTIPKPQEEYNILVNNTNKPFDHVWLERREDGSFIHPLEMLSVTDFVNRNGTDEKPVEPPSLESTPFKFVEDVAELKKLASKLHGVSEFAVDLEHNQYRSFLGLTCLMQISTRTEDFVVDTLKLRVHIGPHLREVFKDPTKRKVLHGADKDILWLQRDFGIYVCNMFDTGQASRLLQLERNSLEYLLRHYCGVTANKEYQNADWRLRPLPEEMIKYAREDTHYLLYLYDVMSRELQSASTDLETDNKLLEVYKRSSEICMQLYQKDLLTETSYMHIYGLREADFNSQQLAVVAGLCKWRDDVARMEDESTGYILPNRLLIDIARHLPSSTNQLRRLLRSRHPFVERNFGSVVSIVQKSVENAPNFEYAAEQLRKDRLETMSELNKESICDDSEMPQITEESTARENLASDDMDEAGIQTTNSLAGSSFIVDHVEGRADYVESDGYDASVVHLTMESQASTKSEFRCPTASSDASDLSNGCTMLNSAKVNATSVSVSRKPTGGLGALFGGRSRQFNTHANISPSDLAKAPSVPVLKKPTGALSALLGSSVGKSSVGSILGPTDLKKNESKLQQIKSSVSLPFHTFSGVEIKPEIPRGGSPSQPPKPGPVDVPSDKKFQAEEIIPLEIDSDDSQLSEEIADADDEMKDTVQKTAELGETDRGHAHGKETSSLAELSSSFEKCFKPLRQTNNSGNKPQVSTNLTQFQPFDYAAARKTVDFTGGVQRDEADCDGEGESASKGSRRKKKGSSSTVLGESRRTEFQAPRRRQAFPPTGNRSGTFL